MRRLPTGDDRQVGGYAVWLPHTGPGRDGLNWKDITAVVARDPSGNAVASIP